MEAPSAHTDADVGDLYDDDEREASAPREPEAAVVSRESGPLRTTRVPRIEYAPMVDGVPSSDDGTGSRSRLIEADSADFLVAGGSAGGDADDDAWADARLDARIRQRLESLGVTARGHTRGASGSRLSSSSSSSSLRHDRDTDSYDDDDDNHDPLASLPEECREYLVNHGLLEK
jgi:hypothetical protein